ncbi:terminase [Escherichia coli]|nr:terminase [Escherichia coli]
MGGNGRSDRYRWCGGGLSLHPRRGQSGEQISPVSESPIDPFGATGLSHDLADEDLNPVTIIQNYTNMSDPMKELEAAIESGRFHHGRQSHHDLVYRQRGRQNHSG